MKRKTLLLFLLSAGLCTCACNKPAQAQVISNQADTIVDSSRPEGHVILGGSVQQQNIFHSFSQLDTTNGQLINFIAQPNTTNIISRVTDHPDTINGLIT